MDATDADAPVSRRGFLRTATGAVAVAGATGTAAAQEGNSSSGGETVAVGAGSGLSFDPEELTIAPGTTVTWEWTGQGGAHNVVADDGAFNSGDPEEGDDITFSHTFPDTGEFPYHCVPHREVGMVGTIIVEEGGGFERWWRARTDGAERREEPRDRRHGTHALDARFRVLLHSIRWRLRDRRRELSGPQTSSCWLSENSTLSPSAVRL